MKKFIEYVFCYFEEKIIKTNGDRSFTHRKKYQIKIYFNVEKKKTKINRQYFYFSLFIKTQYFHKFLNQVLLLHIAQDKISQIYIK